MATRKLTKPTRKLTYQVETTLSQKSRYGGMRVPIDALMVREFRKLGQWFERPRARVTIAKLVPQSPHGAGGQAGGSNQR